MIDIIARNPNSVVPDLAFSVTTYDEIDGSEIAIDSSQIVIPLLNTPGNLNNLSIEFDHSISNYFPAVATIQFQVNHRTELNGAKLKVIFPQDFKLVHSDHSEI